jgi:hypothetical protein
MVSHGGAPMCRSPASKLTILWLCATAVPLAQRQPWSTVPATEVGQAVLTAAGTPGVEPMASALATARIPAGFVTSVDDQSVGTVTAGTASQGPPVALQEVIEQFLRKHSDYTLGRSDWALVIRPRAQTFCNAAVDRVLLDASISDPAYIAFWKLARIVNPSGTPTGPPSVLRGGGGRYDAGEQQHYDFHVALSLNRATLQEALSQIVSQVPGLVWVMRDERRKQQIVGTTERICRLSYFDAKDFLQTSYVFANTTEWSR